MWKKKDQGVRANITGKSSKEGLPQRHRQNAQCSSVDITSRAGARQNQGKEIKKKQRKGLVVKVQGMPLDEQEITKGLVKLPLGKNDGSSALWVSKN